MLESVIAFRNLLTRLPTSGAIFPLLLMPSLHTHDHVHRHTRTQRHSCSHNVQLHEPIEQNKIYKDYFREIFWWGKRRKNVNNIILYRSDM